MLYTNDQVALWRNSKFWGGGPPFAHKLNCYCLEEFLNFSNRPACIYLCSFELQFKVMTIQRAMLLDMVFHGRSKPQLILGIELSYLRGFVARQQMGSEGSDASRISCCPETSLSCINDYKYEHRVRECFIRYL